MPNDAVPDCTKKMTTERIKMNGQSDMSPEKKKVGRGLGYARRENTISSGQPLRTTYLTETATRKSSELTRQHVFAPN